MNQDVTAKIDEVLGQVQPGVRDRISRHLRACEFTDPSDPVLAAVFAQALIAAQPVRLAESGGAAVATEAGLARLGDRVEATACSLARAKIQTIVLGWLLAAMIGGGGVLLGVKLRPRLLAGWFDIPQVEDNRLRTLRWPPNLRQQGRVG